MRVTPDFRSYPFCDPVWSGSVCCRVVCKVCRSERIRQTISVNDIAGEVAAVKPTTAPQTGFGASPEGVKEWGREVE